MGRPQIEELEKLNLNLYEAVIVASQHARRLNARRLQQLEQMEEDPSIDIDSRKITAVALRDVLDGKVKFKRSDSM
ncbi:MAG: DNA-directed RNA polymerase subunit omega [candidate division Zixibacteria bacterium]|nr:DNA-directed RNA polymerase subunit omega [candidate division Zixibacteria bacterium]